MYNIARKNTLQIHLRRMSKEFKKNYNFFPQTWLYPCDSHEIYEYYQRKLQKRREQLADGKITQEESDQNPPVTFIIKPDANSQGKGIFLTTKFEELQQKVDSIFKR